MDYSKMRQQIYFLDKERRQLLPSVLRPGKMIQGSLYRMWRLCGNPRCICVKGKKHMSWYLSWHAEGRTKLAYLGRTVPLPLEERVNRYRRHQRILARIREIDGLISAALNKLREGMIQPLEKAQKEWR